MVEMFFSSRTNILLIYNVSSIFWSAKISLFSFMAKQIVN